MFVNVGGGAKYQCMPGLAGGWAGKGIPFEHMCENESVFSIISVFFVYPLNLVN